MAQLLENIDRYLNVQEKKDAIDLSLDSNSDLKDIIEVVRNSSDKEKIITMFDEKVRVELQILIDGGII